MTLTEDKIWKKRNIIMERRPISTQKYYISHFKADINNIKRIINDALAYFDDSCCAMDEGTRYDLKVIINELLVNAVKHGGKSRDRCHVKVVAGLSGEDCAFLIVEDDGDGYDVARMNRFQDDSAENRSIECVEETGRGIYIVKSLCDDFLVNEKGNKVVIIKRLRRVSADVV